MTKKYVKRDVYQEVTDVIIDQLETHGTDWTKPWSSAGAHHNLISHNPYHGINTILLGVSAVKQGFGSNVWATFKQWKEKGGHIKKGSHGTHIIFWKILQYTDKDHPDPSDPEHIRKFPLLKQYVVFNADQVEGVEFEEPEQVGKDNHVLENAQALIDATGAQVNHGGDKAYFAPGPDYIQLPHLTDFVDSEYYYSTAFHELTHWSGHKSRLDRNLTGQFGEKDYAREELVAELGAAFLCAHTGVNKQPRDDHAKYLNNWLQVLREDNHAIFGAASKAQKAADYLIDYQDLHDEIDEQEKAA